MTIRVFQSKRQQSLAYQAYNGRITSFRLKQTTLTTHQILEKFWLTKRHGIWKLSREYLMWKFISIALDSFEFANRSKKASLHAAVSHKLGVVSFSNRRAKRMFSLPNNLLRVKFVGWLVDGREPANSFGVVFFFTKTDKKSKSKESAFYTGHIWDSRRYADDMFAQKLSTTEKMATEGWLRNFGGVDSFVETGAQKLRLIFTFGIFRPNTSRMFFRKIFYN